MSAPPLTPAAGETSNPPWNPNYNIVGSGDRRLAYSRQSSMPLRSPSLRPHLTRSDSSLPFPPASAKSRLSGSGGAAEAMSASAVVKGAFSGSRSMRKLGVMIFLNVGYSAAEFLIGLLFGNASLVSDAFHLTFGCGLLTFSLFAMAVSRSKSNDVYSYGYRRLEVLSAFTNALFLLFLSFQLAVEALHAFMQDESEHKHYLIVSAVTNLLVNLLGVWFFRGYARVNIVYRSAEDMNYHSVALHVLADSIRSAGLILSSWLLTLGVENAEVLCNGLVSVTVFMLALPLFKATGNILLQIAPASIPPSAFSKCCRQIAALDDVVEVSQARCWELVPGHSVGSLLVKVKNGADELGVLRYVHGLYHELGVQDLTVQTECV